MERMQLHIAIPAMDEMAWLPQTLESLAGQSLRDFKLWICVNQPESWWDNPEKRGVCEGNAHLLEWLAAYDTVECAIIDRSGRGRGWRQERGCVGLARQSVMDAIAAAADERAIIVSLDSDTLLDRDYLAGVRQSFADNPSAAGYTASYYHRLTGECALDRAILRYEIYLRLYLIHLLRIGSPYAFTAMGSALATTLRSYRRVGGISPKQSGEDFYFLQKLAKLGPLIHGTGASVYPGVRPSTRVLFGTGPALAAGFGRMRSQYPLFESALFDAIAATTTRFGTLYDGDSELPLSAFLRQTLNCESLWSGLRKNHTTRERFVRACHERVDGLRIFQYLRTHHDPAVTDEASLFQALTTVFQEHSARLASPAARAIIDGMASGWSFDSAPIAEIDTLRDLLRAIENTMRLVQNRQTLCASQRRHHRE